jgi:dihydroflavonol-4-reductase
MKVFITGGNGFIGSHVVRKLHDRGYFLRCLLRETSKTGRIDEIPYERHLGDIRDLASLQEGMKGCDAVIHLASLSSWQLIRSPLMKEIVLDGTRNVLKAAGREGKLRTVFVSSAAAVNGTRTPELCHEETPFDLDGKRFIYAGLKHEAEKLCFRAAQEGLPVVIVNPCETYGAGDEDLITAGNLRDTLKSWPAISWTGGCSIAGVGDIAAGIVAALEKGRPGERYILGGENVTVRQLIEMTLEAAGQRKPVLQLPNGLIKAVIKTIASLHLPTPILPDLLDYACLFWWMDCTKAQRELGYTYRPAREVIGDVVRWLQESGRI